MTATLPSNKHLGFTLVEVMSVVLITGLLTVAAKPMIDNYSELKAVSEVQGQFGEALSKAREVAVTQGGTVAVCGSYDGKTCSANAWSRGWVVYQVEDGLSSATSKLVNAEQIVASHIAEYSDWGLHVFDELNQAVDELRFDSRGFSVASSRITASFCEKGSAKTHDAWVIERTGRVRSSAEALSGNAGQNAGVANKACNFS